MKIAFSLFKVLSKVSAELRGLDVEFALVGGMAVTARGAIRLTRDVDLALMVKSDNEAEQILGALMRRGYFIETLIEHKTSGRLSTARVLAPINETTSIVVDLIFCTCGIEFEIIRESSVEELLPGLKLPVAKRSHLVAMKVLSADSKTRPRDLEDIYELLNYMSAREVNKVKVLLSLIMKRGYGRNRKLLSNFKNILKQRKSRLSI